jgi:hypothetical protein
MVSFSDSFAGSPPLGRVQQIAAAVRQAEQDPTNTRPLATAFGEPDWQSQIQTLGTPGRMGVGEKTASLQLSASSGVLRRAVSSGEVAVSVGRAAERAEVQLFSTPLEARAAVTQLQQQVLSFAAEPTIAHQVLEAPRGEVSQLHPGTSTEQSEQPVVSDSQTGTVAQVGKISSPDVAESPVAAAAAAPQTNIAPQMAETPGREASAQLPVQVTSTTVTFTQGNAPGGASQRHGPSKPAPPPPGITTPFSQPPTSPAPPASTAASNPTPTPPPPPGKDPATVTLEQQRSVQQAEAKNEENQEASTGWLGKIGGFLKSWPIIGALCGVAIAGICFFVMANPPALLAILAIGAAIGFGAGVVTWGLESFLTSCFALPEKKKAAEGKPKPSSEVTINAQPSPPSAGTAAPVDPLEAARKAQEAAQKKKDEEAAAQARARSQTVHRPPSAPPGRQRSSST